MSDRRAGLLEYKRTWNRQNREKRRAHKKVENALIRGDLVRPKTCEWCGADDCRIEGHHDDYENPLDIIWLCPSCHAIADGRTQNWARLSALAPSLAGSRRRVKGLRVGEKQVCKHGHPFTYENTYWKPDGHRACRECRRLSIERFKTRQKMQRTKTGGSAPASAGASFSGDGP